jgi:hypothetical protein
LEDGYWFYRRVEIRGKKIPKELGPEETFQRGGDLIWENVSNLLSLVVGCLFVQAPAVMTMSLARWFLTNFPIAVEQLSICVWDQIINIEQRTVRPSKMVDLQVLNTCGVESLEFAGIMR